MYTPVLICTVVVSDNSSGKAHWEIGCYADLRGTSISDSNTWFPTHIVLRQIHPDPHNSPSVCRVADLKNPHWGMAWHMQRAVRLPVILSPLRIIRRTIQMSESELSRCLFSYGVFEQCLQKSRARKYWPSHLAHPGTKLATLQALKTLKIEMCLGLSEHVITN